MEEILRKLQKEASGNKYKAIRDACTLARETLEAQNGSGKTSPSKLRERCLFPLRLALESRNLKLAQTALVGMQKILCEDHLVAVEPEVPEKQLLSQVLEAVSVTPTLHEDLQVEVMKWWSNLGVDDWMNVKEFVVEKLAEYLQWWGGELGATVSTKQENTH